jgi:hypothetical protein
MISLLKAVNMPATACGVLPNSSNMGRFTESGIIAIVGSSPTTMGASSAAIRSVSLSMIMGVAAGLLS